MTDDEKIALTLKERIENAPERMDHDPGRGDLKHTDEFRVIVSAAERDLLLYCINYRFSPHRQERHSS